MSDEDDKGRQIEGREFDTPLVLPPAGNVEPQRYIAEVPFDLTKYEFEVLRRKATSDLVFTSIVSATIGMAILLFGKFLVGVATQTEPAWEKWEWATLGVGVVASIILRFSLRTASDKEREKLLKVIDGHFATKKPRRIHFAGKE